MYTSVHTWPLCLQDAVGGKTEEFIKTLLLLFQRLNCYQLTFSGMLYPKLDLKLEASSLAMSAKERASANKPATAWKKKKKVPINIPITNEGKVCDYDRLT